MEYKEFITIVAHEAVLDDIEQAERAAQATLETLARRLSPGQARDLLAELPAELKPWIHPRGERQIFDADEFLRRVSGRLGVDMATAERLSRAVFYALGRAVSTKEIADLAADLPGDFEPLIAEAQGRFAEILPAEEFVNRVATRAGLDTRGAQRATEATLETLAERVAGGDVDDLIGQLPVQLHGALKRGRSESPDARRMSLDRFLARIAQREGVSPDKARAHARAVLATLREAVADKEFFDLDAQLPAEFRTLIA
ncbi:DUF2267 domain-containing protein [Actinomadura sp. HBU206391]|uniref:DUF2267 domain-containing protein n=1 Tax=Actinomadura sp. HBU206391 TaxID=2731692 RepID=UPI00164FD217|nr:DUF2267 domain-containing protein [Actinomadura sp. HBU206391]MBC6458940.1 DUF2267 domain-containing protein [Actinomadura sp. HBU206391]